MSIASPVNADYSTCIETLRGHIAKGTQPSAYEMRLCIAVLKDAVSRLDGIDTVVTAQFAILQAFTGASNINDVIAAIDTAETAITDEVSVPTYVASTVADGS